MRSCCSREMKSQRAHRRHTSSRRDRDRRICEAALETFAPDFILSDYTLAGVSMAPMALEIANRSVAPTRRSYSSPARSVKNAPSRRLKPGRGRLRAQGQPGTLGSRDRARHASDVEERDARRWAQHKLEESEERFRFAMHYLLRRHGAWSSPGWQLARRSIPALCEIMSATARRNCSVERHGVDHLSRMTSHIDAGPAGKDMLSRSISSYQTDKRYVRKERPTWCGRR